jgi:hypothetical protein
MDKSFIYWVAASGGVKAGQIVKSSTGAAPVAAAHTGQTILGLAMEDAAAGTAAKIYPLGGTVLEIDFDSASTLQTASDSMLGTLYDIKVDSTSGEMTLDLDDVTDAYCFLVGYDNAKKKARIVVDAADLLIT